MYKGLEFNKQNLAYFIERLNQTLEEDAIYFMVDGKETIRYASDSFFHFTGLHHHHVLGTDHRRFLILLRGKKAMVKSAEGVLHSFTFSKLTMPKYNPLDPAFSFFVLHPCEEITASFIDERTGLPNKRALLEVMKKHEKQPFTLVYGRFTEREDRWAEGLKNAQSHERSIYVIDEFTFCCFVKGRVSEQEAEEKITECLNPFKCILTAVVNEHSSSGTEELLKRAKQKNDTGQNKAEMMEERLKQAIHNQSLSLVYQPQVDLHKEKVIGVEALLRWNDEVLGCVAPLTFIPVAEKTGLIKDIGLWVLEEACRQASLWKKEGLPVRMSVNISAVQCRDREFIQQLGEIIRKTDMNPWLLSLEITESFLLSQLQNGQEVLEGIKELGVHLSIDDFGTGYSTLSYLKNFPVDSLKIDQSFIRDVLIKEKDEVIVTSVIKLARNMNVKVVAEGVESSEVLTFLKENDCDEVQGYLYCKPLPPHEVTPFLLDGSARQILS
ncbi:EAL domain-containing protein [Bacillus sp. H-16]|uniref:putative bifunctional diguanylate cyclase/phosphodiesterase n=1 Tax=Alteribacter salitolerans TaxID=2912333 RepID=UPI001963CBF6|nr:EAL domain-containing protein [Alteribacter salitolerans]MBM7097628.1 EAL domain-containing protein [Alteribacter salitolerans]